MPSRATPYTWIGRDEGLREACHRLAQADVVALDIEFMRFNTYYPQAALYQLASDSEIFLVDAVAVQEYEPLVDLLVSDEITKVVHGAGEDMEVIRTHLQIAPKHMFDTQVAASVAGHGWCIGYATLVSNCLGVELSKQEQRSDWLTRPLSKAQIQYSLQDVAYLLDLHAILEAELRALGRREWFDEEVPVWLEREEALPENYYIKLGGMRRMRPRQRAVLRALCEWRELEARRRNRPRQWLVRDEHLLKLARREVLEETSLLEDVPRDVVQRYGRGLSKAFAQGMRSELPPAMAEPLPDGSKAIVNEILAEITKMAAELKVPQELLGRRREIENSVREWLVENKLSDYLSGWRQPILSPLFVKKLGPQRAG